MRFSKTFFSKCRAEKFAATYLAGHKYTIWMDTDGFGQTIYIVRW